MEAISREYRVARCFSARYSGCSMFSVISLLSFGVFSHFLSFDCRHIGPLDVGMVGRFPSVLCD